MYLRRLNIHSLPGIKPGFAFEPGSDKVNIVAGPNAIGKSSLIRALKYLLADVDPRNDPPGLHLEGEFLSGDVRWTVRRSGREVAWMRDGEPATPPALPGADRFGLYPLSVESLLAENAGDRDLAAALWRTLRGGFDLDRARRSVGPRFGGADARTLAEEARALRTVEGAYADLHQEEAKLPALERQIAHSEQAEVHGRRLQTALDLHKAIDTRQACADELEGFSVHMAQLRGDEPDDLKALEEKIAQLREQRSTAEREIGAADRALERTGLQDSRPDAEEMAGIEELLRQTEVEFNNLDRAGTDLKEAEAVFEDAAAQLEGNGEAAEPAKAEAVPDNPAKQLAGNAGTARLKPRELDRAREILEPLVEAQFRRKELHQRLKLAGAPPDEAELEQFRDGSEALRAWLATSAAVASSPAAARVWFVTRIFWWATLTLSGLLAAVAIRAGAWTVFGVLAFGIAILLIFSWFGRRASALADAPAEDAKRRYAGTGLDLPPEWSEGPVREHLRQHVQRRFDDLRLQKKQSEGVERLRQEIEEDDSKIAELEAHSSALAREIGIDPPLTGAPLYRFIDITNRFDEARVAHVRTVAVCNDLQARIAESAVRIRDFLDEWRGEEASRLGASASREDLNALRIALDSLKARMKAASDADGIVEAGNLEIDSLNGRIAEAETSIAKLFERAGLKADVGENDVREDIDGTSRGESGGSIALEAGARETLVGMINRLGDWSRVRKALDEAKTEEHRLRKLLSGENGLVESVEGGSVDELKRQLRETGEQAGKRTDHIEEKAAINARLQEARRSHKLEEAARAKDQAAEALRDKRDEALACAATEVLLDDVESAFKTEREPDLLRRARQWFEQVTSHAFTLELRDTDRFVALDKKLGEWRALNELSSGTRMQLLLALRLAWTEDLERGGDTLPLFFDEALTTSDVDRFSVMARTISRLADAGRQIFYLSARRHEAALWEQATGAAPAMIDLAAVRFGSMLPDPDALRVEAPPTLPSPDGLAAEKYAALIGVHPVNPRVDAGGIHLFHLLRDDLDLLHGLLDTWRIGTLGQLESLLASNAARSAIAHRQTRQRLRHRCRTARCWTELWRQGRGMPVDRAVLDQCDAVAPVFLDRAAALAAKLGRDGEALVRALRAGKLKHFRKSKTDELEKWLADKGYVDDAATLEPDERHRLTLQRVVPPTRIDAEDANRVVEWLESAAVS